MELPFGLNPYENDPGAWGASLINNAELLLAALDAAGARSVVEVGAYAGDFTRLLLLWAEGSGASIVAVDPAPQPQLVELAGRRQELSLVRETSLAALPGIAPVEAIILDGDHNYYTVSAELRSIEAGHRGTSWPLVVLHDVGWPHARRDDYFDPGQIPAEFRQPTHEGGGLYPGIEGVRPGGMPYKWPAASEGGARNGVLTAVEDFTAAHPELRLAVLAPFFGVGLLWHRERSYAPALEELVAPLDRNPLIERLERNRVLHLASSQVQLAAAREAQRRLAEIEPLLDEMLKSRAFQLTERFVRWRSKGRPPFTAQALREALGRG
jgi:hypothetical protein